MQRLEPSVWNLFSQAPVRRWAFAAIATTACGPVVGVGESTDTDDPTSPTDPSDPTSPTDPTDPTGNTCNSNAECDYDESCIDGVCQYDYDCYCGCYGAAPQADRFRCSPWYECYSDDECGEGNICEFGSCVPGGECDDIPEIVETIPLQFSPSSSGSVTAMAVGNVSQLGTPDLLVARGAFIERFFPDADEGGVLLQGPATITAFVTADFDGDGLGDVLTAEDGDDGQLRLWRGDGVSVAEADVLIPQPGVRALAVGDHDGDGNLDVFAHIDRDIVLLGGTGTGSFASFVPLVQDQVDLFTVLDADQDGLHDLVFADGQSVWLQAAAPEGQALLLGPAEGEFLGALIGADFNGDGPPELTALSAPPSALSTFLGPITQQVAIATFLDGGATGATVGRLDGDLLPDLVIGRSDGFSVRYGRGIEATSKPWPEPFRCDRDYLLGVDVQRIAAMDSTGSTAAVYLVVDDTVQRVDLGG